MAIRTTSTPTPRPASDEPLIVVASDLAHDVFLAGLALEFGRRTGIPIELSIRTDGEAIRSIADGVADVAGVCRPKGVGAGEQGLTFRPVAWGALVVLVHPDNPIEDISVRDVGRVLRGEITNWAELGGDVAPIDLLRRADQDAGVPWMTRALLLGSQDEITAISGASRLLGANALEQAVVHRRHAIGLSGYFSAMDSGAKMLSLDGRQPDDVTVRQGRYPAMMPLYVVVAGDHTRVVARFLEFASRDGQDLIASEGIIRMSEGAHLWPLYREQMRRATHRSGR